MLVAPRIVNDVSYEPCCKLSCIVSRIEVTFTQGFEGFT